MWVPVLRLVLVLEGFGAVLPAQAQMIGKWNCRKSQPWQAALYHARTFLCAGVLVHPQWVLTAAHCKSNGFNIWLGRQRLFPVASTAQYFRATHRILHPQFNVSLFRSEFRFPEDDFSHDLMLLRLDRPARITEAVQVLGLPSQEPRIGASCYTANWGLTFPYQGRYTISLQCADLRVLPRGWCEKPHLQKVTEHMLCAGLLKRGQSLCGADSMGPLICNGVFQGLGSWDPNRCDDIRLPGVYSKVLEHVLWIQETLAAYP